MQHHERTNVDYFENSIENSVSMFLRHNAKNNKGPRNDCEQFGMQGTVKELLVDLKKMFPDEKERTDFLFKKDWRKMPHEMAINADCEDVKNRLHKILTNVQTAGDISRQSAMFRVLNTPKNKEVFIQPLPPRNIELCLIVLEELDQKEIFEAASYHR